MVYVDTNVLVYISVNQGEEKRDLAAQIVRKLIKENKLFISPLTIQEFIFTLAKLDIESEQMTQDVNYYMDFVEKSIDKNILKNAYALCKEMNFCKNISDIIHLKLAEQYCQKLVTFDEDFKKFKNRSNIEIEIFSTAKKIKAVKDQIKDSPDMQEDVKKVISKTNKDDKNKNG